MCCFSARLRLRAWVHHWLAKQIGWKIDQKSWDLLQLFCQVGFVLCFAVSDTLLLFLSPCMNFCSWVKSVLCFWVIAELCHECCAIRGKADDACGMGSILSQYRWGIKCHASRGKERLIFQGCPNVIFYLWQNYLKQIGIVSLRKCWSPSYTRNVDLVWLRALGNVIKELCLSEWI